MGCTEHECLIAGMPGEQELCTRQGHAHHRAQPVQHAVYLRLAPGVQHAPPGPAWKETWVACSSCRMDVASIKRLTRCFALYIADQLVCLLPVWLQLCQFYL